MGLLDMFKKQRKLRVTIIDEVGNVYDKVVKYENNTFHIKEWGQQPGAYIVDHNFVIYDKKSHMPRSFYYKNNPNPIRLQHERNDDVDSVGFKRLLDAKTIQDLFSDEGLKKMTLLMILVIVVIVLNIVMLLAQFGVIKAAGAAAGTGG